MLALLGPGKAALLLRLLEEGLGGGGPRGQLQLLLDDVPDGPSADVPETGDELLEASRRLEGVLVDLLLHLLLDGRGDLPVPGASPRIPFARGGAGDPAVSSCSPVSRLHGDLPPLTQGGGWDL